MWIEDIEAADDTEETARFLLQFSVSMSPHVQPSKKLTKKDLDALSPQDKSVYLLM